MGSVGIVAATFGVRRPDHVGQDQTLVDPPVWSSYMVDQGSGL